MRLSEFKHALEQTDTLSILQTDGRSVPAHFHITELGLSTKHFLDCGGTERIERKATLQLWSSIDYHHRLKSEKVIGIIEKTAPLFGDTDPEIEVEYQQDTIGLYGLEFENGRFQLVGQQTDCLAKEKCGVPVEKVAKALSSLKDASCCEPNSGCC